MNGKKWAVRSGQGAVGGGQLRPIGARRSRSWLQASGFMRAFSSAFHFPLRTAHRPPPTSSRGISLLEVLASIGVLSIGLFGLAALLPIGRYTINEAIKADRTGDCGRAAMRDVVVRRMLDAYPTYPNPPPPGSPNPPPATYPQWLLPNTDTDAVPSLGLQSFIIDPRGAANGLTAKFGGVVPRITLGVSPVVRPINHKRYYTASEADRVFLWPDDLVVEMPEDMHPPQPVGRPTVMADPTTGMPSNIGDYSWFASVVPMPNDPLRFTVSVVVCCKRDFSETTATIATTPVNDFYDNGLGGGSVKLSNISGPFDFKENDWIALCGTNPNKPIPTLCRWYRIASVGDDGVSLTLIGPDWDTSYKTVAVALGQSVLGVYTTTIELDTDPTWTN